MNDQFKGSRRSSYRGSIAGGNQAQWTKIENLIRKIRIWIALLTYQTKRNGALNCNSPLTHYFYIKMKSILMPKWQNLKSLLWILFDLISWHLKNFLIILCLYLKLINTRRWLHSSLDTKMNIIIANFRHFL